MVRAREQRAAVAAALVDVRHQSTMPTRPAGPGTHDAALTMLVEQIRRAGTMFDAEAEAASALSRPRRRCRHVAVHVATLQVAARSLLTGDEIPDAAVLLDERTTLRDAEVDGGGRPVAAGRRPGRRSP